MLVGIGILLGIICGLLVIMDYILGKIEEDNDGREK